MQTSTKKIVFTDGTKMTLKEVSMDYNDNGVIWMVHKDGETRLYTNTIKYIHTIRE